MAKELSKMTLEELWELFPIILTEYNDEWDNWYSDELTTLTKLLESFRIKRISHIGSTAIKNIIAKPTVDILIEINNDADIDAVKTALIKSGYTLMCESENRASFNKGYTPDGFAEKVYHLHLRYSHDNDELYFRDYMNDCPEKAHEYEELKKRLYKKYEHNRDAYTDAKADFVKMCTAKAREIYGGRYD